VRPGPLGTTVLPYLNVGTNAHEQARAPDVQTLADIDRAAITTTVAESGGAIVGLKLRLVGPVVEEQGEALTDLATSVARDCGLPLMVHIGQPLDDPGRVPGRTEAVTGHLLRTLGAGDIVTHICTPFAGGLGELGPALRDAADGARRRGVRFDIGVGRRQFSHRLARQQRETGFSPDTISTDLTRVLATITSLVECMSMLMAVGYEFAEVVAMATTNAASTLNAPQLGTIAVGAPADLTIVDLVPGTFEHTDGTGASFGGSRAIRPVLTIKNGQPVTPGPGPHPWGWLPPFPSLQKG
jgi:dihydroorotase